MATVVGKRAGVAAAALLIFIWSGGACAARPGSFSFVHITDVHIPTYLFAIGQSLDEETLLRMPHQQRLAQLARECLVMEPRPALVINSGDTCDVGWSPLLRLYQKLMRPLVSAGIPVFTVVGNHDLDYTGIGVQDLAEFFDPLGPAGAGRGGPRYSFDTGGCHFIILNNRPVTGLIRLTPGDIDWLSRDLKKVNKDAPLLVFLHADMPVEDTFKVAERLQPFASPVIFQGHAHSEALDRWGRVPVVVTGALYGGTPKSGSYRVVTVRRTEISIKTRDFADPAATFGPAKMIEFSEPGPRIRLITPKRSAAVRGTLAIRAVTQPFREGIMEYAIPGFINWTPLRGEKGTWRGEAAAPSRPGRHLLTVRFRGPAGSTVLAHTRFKVPAARVREAWERDLGSAVQAAPAIWQNLAVVPTRDRGVYALRLDSGRVAWHKGLEHGQIIGRVVSDGASVYYGAGRVIQARSAETGESRWQTVLGGTLIAGLTIGGDRLFAPAGEHQLYCLDRRSGKILWEYAAALPIMMEPATDGRRVYFGAVDGSVRSLEAASGREVWKVQLSAMADNYTTAPFWPPVLAGDKVIISKLPVGKDEDNILALAAANGEIAWTGRAAGAALRLALSPEGGRLYAPCRNGLQCLSTKDGTSVWSRETGVGMSAAMAGGDVVLIRDDHDVGCVEAATGNVLWTYRVCTGPQGTYYGPGAFAVQGNLAVIGTVDGHVIGLTW